jgi:hypothetical protein
MEEVEADRNSQPEQKGNRQPLMHNNQNIPHRGNRIATTAINTQNIQLLQLITILH